MNSHKHARLTYARRVEMVRQITEEGLSVAEAAALHGVTAATARKWLGRFLAGGEAGLVDASSRPHRSPRSIEPATALLIVELRRRRMLHSKKLGRIVRPSHRVTGNRRDSVDGAGWETLFVAVDDHARIAFKAMHPDEKTPQAVQFLRDAVAYFAKLGITIERLLTDNGSAFRSKDFSQACKQLVIVHKFTRAYRPQTNGKAERFIQSALREWAYGWTYQHSTERAAALASWKHHYNGHRPHAGIGGNAPMSRLPASRHNVLTLHS